MTLRELAERYTSNYKFRVFFDNTYFATYSSYELSNYPIANKKVIDYAESKKNTVFVTLSAE